LPVQVPLDEVKAAFAANVFGLLDMVQVRGRGIRDNSGIPRGYKFQLSFIKPSWSYGVGEGVPLLPKLQGKFAE
jgi:hypothetical protein